MQQSITYLETASLTINGITPVSGSGVTLLANPSYSATAGLQDYVTETFVVNPITTATSLGLGKIVLGKIIWLQTNSPVVVTLTQSAVDKDIVVNSFLFLNCDFTAVKIANTSTTAAANISVVIAGNRADVGTGPGIY